MCKAILRWKQWFDIVLKITLIWKQSILCHSYSNYLPLSTEDLVHLVKLKKKTYLKEICCCLENCMNNSHLQMVIYYLVIFRFFFFGCIAHSSLWVRLQTLIISFPIIAYTQHRRQHKHRMHSHTSAYIHTQINRWRRILFIQTLSANEIS